MVEESNWPPQKKIPSKNPALLELRSVGGMGNFARDNFFMEGWEPEEGWFWLRIFEPFEKPKATFYKYWTSIKIKITMICVYKEYKVKIKWYRSNDYS